MQYKSIDTRDEVGTRFTVIEERAGETSRGASYARVRNVETGEELYRLNSVLLPVPSEGRTILDRALNGRDMAALALTGSNRMALEDYETGLVDALVNLMHFARRYDIDFDAQLASARRHFDAERRYGWDEVPS